MNSKIIFLIQLIALYSYCNEHKIDHHSHSQDDYETSKPQYQKQFENYFQNNIIKIFISILIVSLPSLPIFLLLKFFTNLMQKDQECFIKQYILDKMISFAVGTIIGDIFLHMFPSFDYLSGNSKNYSFIIIGIILFYLCDYIIKILTNKKGKCHTHDQCQDNKLVKDNQKQIEVLPNSSQNQSAVIYLLGDFLHNFTDGITIGASYSVSFNQNQLQYKGTTLGISSTIAIALHEIPHELGDFAFLLKQNYSLFSIFKTQLGTSLGALIGGIIGLTWGEFYKVQILGFTIGSFLYLSLTILLPEIHAKKSSGFLSFNLNIICMSIGVYLMQFLCAFE